LTGGWNVKWKTREKNRGLLKGTLHGLYSVGYTDTDCTLQDILKTRVYTENKHVN